MTRPLKKDFVVNSLEGQGFIDLNRYNLALESYIDFMESYQRELEIIIETQNKYL